MNKLIVPISFGFGVGFGIIIGASTAFLIAPHSGKITRNKLKNTYQEKLEKLNEKIIDAQQLADNLKNKLPTD